MSSKSSPPEDPAPEGALGRRITSEVMVTSSLHAVALASDLLFTAILARLLLPADYGVVAAAMVFIAFCNLLREVGIGATIIQLPTLTADDQRTGTTLVMIVSALIFAMAQLLAPAFAAFMDLLAAEPVLRALSLIIVIQGFASVSEGLLLRALKVRKVMTVELISKFLAYATVGIGMAATGFGYWALVGAMLCDAVLRSIVLVALARPSLKPQLNFTAARRLLTVGGGFTLSRVINFIALRADVVVIGRYLDSASLGLYSRAYKLMSLPTDLYNKVADRVVFPAYASVQGEPERLCSAYLQGVSLTALLGVPMAPILYLLAPEIVDVLLGPGWIGAVPIFSVLGLSIYFRLGARVSGALLRATGSVGQLVFNQTFYAVLTIGGSLVAVRFGIVAVGAAIALAVGLWFCLITVQACRRVNVPIRTFLAAHVRGLILAVGTTALVCSVILPLRSLGFSSIIILLAVGLVLSIIGFVLVRWRPRRLLGKEGTELATQVASFTATTLRRLESWEASRAV